MRKSALITLVAVLAPAQQRVAEAEGETLRGAAIHADRLYAWGRALHEWDVHTWRRRTIAASSGAFGEGGCVDPRGAILLQDGADGGPLVLVSRDGKRAVWDRSVDMHDCVFMTLLGRKGALITNHYGQVRFYEGPRRYREIYSFYTASRQAGLLTADVDSDGFIDIFAGNYWIRSPGRFELSWRLFAINTRHETPDSATMSLTRQGKDLYAAQGHMRDASVYRYRPPSDPAQLWNEHVLAHGLRFPHALAAGPFGVVVGENDGPGSGLYVSAAGERLEKIGTTEGVHSALVVNGRLVTVGARSIDLWDVQRRR